MAARRRRSTGRRRARAHNPVRRRRATVRHHRRASTFRVRRRSRRRSNPSRAVVHHRRRRHHARRRRNPGRLSLGGLTHFAKQLAVAASGAFIVDLASGFVPAAWKAGILGSAVQGGIAYLLYSYAPVSPENRMLLGIGGGVRAAITLLGPVFNIAGGFLRPSNGTSGIAAFQPGMNPFPAYGGGALGMGGIGAFQPGMNMFPAYGGAMIGR